MYHYKAHGLLLTLITGLFFSSQAPALAAAMPQSSTPTTFPPPGLTCATTFASAPLITDCEEALALIDPGEEPQVCTDIFQTQDNIETVGTCIIQTYSQRGKAHCLSPNEIRAGVRIIIDSCRSTEFTKRSYTWTEEGESRDGVRLVKAP